MEIGKRKKSGSPSVRICFSGNGQTAKALELEIGAEGKVSQRDGKIEVIIAQEQGESWATLRSKVNTSLRTIETIIGVAKTLK